MAYFALFLQLCALAATIVLVRRFALAARPGPADTSRGQTDVPAHGDLDGLLDRLDEACLRLEARIARAEDVLECLRVNGGERGQTNSAVLSGYEVTLDPAAEAFSLALAAAGNPQKPKNRKKD